MTIAFRVESPEDKDLFHSVGKVAPSGKTSAADTQLTMETNGQRGVRDRASKKGPPPRGDGPSNLTFQWG